MGLVVAAALLGSIAIAVLIVRRYHQKRCAQAKKEQELSAPPLHAAPVAMVAASLLYVVSSTSLAQPREEDVKPEATSAARVLVPAHTAVVVSEADPFQQQRCVDGVAQISVMPSAPRETPPLEQLEAAQQKRERLAVRWGIIAEVAAAAAEAGTWVPPCPPYVTLREKRRAMLHRRDIDKGMTAAGQMMRREVIDAAVACAELALGLEDRHEAGHDAPVALVVVTEAGTVEASPSSLLQSVGTHPRNTSEAGGVTAVHPQLSVSLSAESKPSSAASPDDIDEILEMLEVGESNEAAAGVAASLQPMRAPVAVLFERREVRGAHNLSPPLQRSITTAMGSTLRWAPARSASFRSLPSRRLVISHTSSATADVSASVSRRRQVQSVSGSLWRATWGHPLERARSGTAIAVDNAMPLKQALSAEASAAQTPLHLARGSSGMLFATSSSLMRAESWGRDQRTSLHTPHPDSSMRSKVSTPRHSSSPLRSPLAAAAFARSRGAVALPHPQIPRVTSRPDNLSMLHRQPTLVMLQGIGSVEVGAESRGVGELPANFKFGSDFEWSSAFDDLD